MGRFETLTVKGLPMRLYIDEPARPGPHPAVVVAHHRWALDEVTQDNVHRLARAGMVAAAPEHYFRRPKGEENIDSLRGVSDADFRDSVEATIAHLDAMPSVQKGNIGIFGQCMGGRTAFLISSTFPIKACCALYSGGMMQPRGGDGPAPIDLLRNIQCPVIGFFGNDDQNPSPADVDRIAATLRSHGKEFAFHRYDGAGHAFQNFKEGSYRKEASDDAWAKLIPFLQSALKVRAPQTAK
jgi:carboxymethylenebutenolidase